MTNTQTALERKTGKVFTDLIRTRYWASFATIETLAEDLGIARGTLLDLMARYPWELQKPPALQCQNAPVPSKPIAGAALIGDFVRDERDTPARLHTQVLVEPEDEQLRITFECKEPHMGALRHSAGSADGETDPFNLGVWEAHFGEWQGEYHWWTIQLRQAGAAGRLDELLRRARCVGPRPYSAFEDDCVIVALTPVNIGQDINYLDVSRFDPNPWQLARELTRPEDCRIYQTGTFYLLAVNPQGATQETYYDPWEGGFFWPSWRSGMQVAAQKLDDAWRVTMTIPFRNLEPLMDGGAVWGVDLFRNRPPTRGREGEYARSRTTVFFRYEGESIALKHWRVTFEDAARHSWCPAVVPHVFETTPRPTPEAAAAFVSTPLSVGKWPADSEWECAERVSEFFDDRTGKPARTKTEVRVLFDTKHLYVRFECYEQHTAQLQVITREHEQAAYPGHLRASFLYRRWEFGMGWGDFVEVALVPSVNGADCYHGGFYDILVNSHGTILESCHDTFGMLSLREEDKWHSRCRVAVDVQHDKWVVQIAIPFESFYGVSSAGEVWNVNFLRMRASKPVDRWREMSAWAPSYGWPRNRGNVRKQNLERFGRLRLPGARFSEWQKGGRAPVVFDGHGEDAHIFSPKRDRSRDPLRGVCFVDEQHGWAVGGLGSIFHTKDGGESWQEQSSGTDYVLESTAFANRQCGWAAGGWLRDKTVATCGGIGIILATKDAGQHWRACWQGKGGWFHDVCFVDEKAGWVCGENGTVLKTEDGGATWTQLQATNTMDILYGICFANRDCGWAVGGNETIISTRDGGRTWTRERCPLLPRPLGTRKTFRAVSAVDPMHCWIVGTEGTVLRTKDGGKTWQLQPLGIDPWAMHVFDFVSVCFVNEQCGWAAGEIGSVIFHTRDGGRTWQGIRTGIGHALSCVHFLDSQTGWAVGERGTRLKSVDGGKSWSIQFVAPAMPGLMYITAHDHHMNGVAGQLAALAVDHEVTCVFRTAMFEVCRAAAWCVGAWQARTWWGFIGGRRRAPGRLHHHYQTKQGLEPLERRLAAAIRALRPEAILCEWPIMDEGYWAGEPAFLARAATHAFASAASADQFPELNALGLDLWQTPRLYYMPRFFNEVYRVHPANTTWEFQDRYSPMLGMRATEAAFRHSCCWRGLLDRQTGRGAIRPLELHLKQEARPPENTTCFRPL